MLQQHRPAFGRAELDMAGTRISARVSRCPATFVAVGLASMCRRPQPDLSTTAEPVIEFKSYDDVLSIRARGRDPASDQRDR